MLTMVSMYENFELIKFKRKDKNATLSILKSNIYVCEERITLDPLMHPTNVHCEKIR